MNLRKSIMATAAGAVALFACSCVGPDGTYVTAGGVGYGVPARTYSNYTVTYGSGYAGTGYYYGPPNLRYYSRSPGVVYYSSRSSVPTHYWPRSSSYYRPVSTPSYRSPYSRSPSYRDRDRWDGRRDGDDRWDRDRDRDDDRDRWDGRRDRDDDDDGRPRWRS
jgi:hypothetical protein